MKKHIYIISLLAYFTFSAAMAQESSKYTTTQKQIWAPDIALIQKRLQVSEANRINRIQKFFPGKDELLKWKDGTLVQLTDVTEEGFPIYTKTMNIDAAATISTSKVWTGGGMGLSLSGAGMDKCLGVWDGGAVLTTHREFGGRATQMDAPSSTNDHSTHVACTMIGTGLDSKAKGGAWQAPIKCYDWTNDDAEMSSAAQLGLLISNHSYGNLCGWTYNSGLNRYEWYGVTSISTTEDYKFGFYSSDAASWDQISLDFPYYLIFKAAGNDRGDKPTNGLPAYVMDANKNWIPNTLNIPADGPYDCVPQDACGKNVITIGAVEKNASGYVNPSSVVMSTFSAWGPTDDGRIKPDLVACGVNLYSAVNTSTSSYGTKSGTSMATPNASGSALLVQQYYKQLHNTFMKAATLKALLIHTADEAGSTTGPDYAYGWGLMNTASAVSAIKDTSSNLILQPGLSNGSTYNYTFYSDGLKPLKATIAWMDQPGVPPPASLDPTTKMLVNDLDIRITRNSDKQVFYPFVMNPATPTAGATTGDNSRDNVEQVFLSNPQSGSYTISVSHKGTLTGVLSQDFSLILSGIIVRPAAAMSVSSRTTCVSSKIQFSDLSGSVSSRVWYFPGGNPSTSSVAEPQITYANSGNYPVALKVTNAIGSDSVYYVDYIKVGGLNLPYKENFEGNGFNFWTIQNNNADSTWRIWKINGTSPGNLAIGINNFDNPTFSSDMVYTPILNFYGYKTVNLSFQHAYTRVDNTSSDSLVIWVSSDCGSTWTRVLAKAENGAGSFATAPNTTYRLSSKAFVPASAADWCGGGIGPACFNVDLSAYAGKANVQVKFEQVGAGGNNMYLDNISFDGTPYKPIAGFSNKNKLICSGAPFQLNDSTQNIANTYSWSIIGTNLTSSDKNPVFTINQVGKYSVKLVVSNSAGIDSMIKTDFIEVLQGASAPTLSADKAQLCGSDSVLLTVSGANTFDWWKDGSFQSAGTSNSRYINQSGIYQVRKTETNGCYASSERIILVRSSYPNKPIINKSFSGNQLCEGTLFTLTSSADSANQWYANTQLLNGRIAKTLTIQDTSNIVVRAGNKGCYSFSDTFTYIRLARPMSSEIFGGGGIAYRSSNDSFWVNPNTGSNYSWSVNPGTIESGQGNSKIIVKWAASGFTGTINMQETGTNGCLGEVKKRSFALYNTGISSLKDFAFTLYPNPIKAGSNLQIQFVNEQSVSIRLIDIQGKVISEKQSVKSENHFIKIPENCKGIYMLEIKNSNESITQKIMVE